jgi:N-acetyl-anhydromuramyl-L-alanine amidase AmpD
MIKRIFIFTSLILFSINVLADTDTLKVISRKVKFGMREMDSREIDAVVVHACYNKLGGNIYGLNEILQIFRAYRVSAHYIIDRKGNVYNLVDEKDVSFHAGRCYFPDGTYGGNSRSIGIELISDSLSAPTNAQMQSLVKLVNSIKQRYSIKYLLKHSDIAPERKFDPWNFDWKKFMTMLNLQSKKNTILQRTKD